MHSQFVLMTFVLGPLIVATVLMATGRMPGPERTVDGWLAARPTMPRRWLEVAFWSNIALAIASTVIVIGTAEQALRAVWNDIAQFLIWVVLALDSVLNGRRVLLGVAAVLLVFSGYEIAVSMGRRLTITV